MPYSLDCDTCEFGQEVADDVAAYSAAKDHETEHPDHFVAIERTG